MEHATFTYAINNFRKLVRLAQLVEKWTGITEVVIRVRCLTTKFTNNYGIRTDLLH